MKKALTLVLALCLPAIAQQVLRKEIGNLITEGVPEVPARIAERARQYQEIRSAQFVDWQQDGKGMLISTRFADAPQLHYVATPGGDRRQVTFQREPITQGWFMPAGGRGDYLFRMDVGGGEFFQYYLLDAKTGRHTLLTDGRSRNEGLTWSNKGARAAFVSTLRNGRDFDLYTVDTANAQPPRLIKELSGSWQPVDWSPDDKQLLLVKFISVNEAYPYLLDLDSGQMTEINAQKGGEKIGYGPMRFSGDGRGIYYVSDEGDDFQHLRYYDLATGQKREITVADFDVEALDISHNGKFIAFTYNEGGRHRLFVGAISDLGHLQAVKLPEGVISNVKFDREDSRVGFTLATPQTPAEAYSIDVATQTPTRWTFSETGGLNAESFVAPELIEYPTFDSVGGKPRLIPSFYYRPRNEAKRPYPVIISIHGGPEGQSQATFSANFQYWVNELEAAVLVPNVRGSSGYGKTYVQLDNGFKREDSVKDIGKLLDWIATRPELDARRVAVIGGSYGGYMVLASMFHFNDRLKCGVDIVGISNFVTFLESTKEYRRDQRRPEYGDERDPKMREFLTTISPNTNAGKITKPLFVIQGANDPRVPIGEAEQIVKTVRGNGGVVWYLIGKDEGHGFQKKSNQEFQTNATSLFFEQYLIK